jgi:hypothetical protein
MKHAISSPNQFLPVYDFLGFPVPGVIEYDDETKEAKMYILNSSNLPVRFKDPVTNCWHALVVTTIIPGSTIEL